MQNIELDKPSERLTTVTFAKSVPMSTYLAAFIVSDFVSVTATAKGLQGRTFPVSVFTTSAQKEKGAFALEVGVSSIEYYINLFNIDYPLPKLGIKSYISYKILDLELSFAILCFRHGSDPRFCLGCYGKLGIDHLQRNCFALRPKHQLDSQ